VIEPLLIDEDYYARVEGREIISNLAKAAGLATMISTMRPDIDNIDEYVRNTTARAFAVVASALGIPSLLPFLKAVCRSKKSWQARHTGIKIVQQIAILMGCAILPHLKSLVEIIEHGKKWAALHISKMFLVYYMPCLFQYKMMVSLFTVVIFRRMRIQKMFIFVPDYNATTCF
jgi:splicing factor 3B subunit 1